MAIMERKSSIMASFQIFKLFMLMVACRDAVAFQLPTNCLRARSVFQTDVMSKQGINQNLVWKLDGRWSSELAQQTEVTAPIDVATAADADVEEKSSGLGNWVFRMYRRFIIALTGFIFVFLLRVLNQTKIHNYKTLEKLMLERDEDVGLFSYSNHHSMLDDPGLPALIMPWLTMPWKKMRWNLCNDGMYFVHPVLTHIFRLGKGLPVTRTEGPNQKYLKDFMLKLENKDWCHIFAEGKIMQPWRFEKDQPHLGDFRIGPAKMLSHQSKSPICLPIYHVGMHNVYPEKQLKDKNGKKRVKGAAVPKSAIPRIGQKIDIFIGEPFDISKYIEKIKNLDATGVTWENDKAYREIQDEITLFIRSKLIEVEEKARPILYKD